MNETKLIEWYNDPRIAAKSWAPCLFWYAESPANPFGRPKVDPLELEVYFAELLNLPSECRTELESRQPGRAEFLAANARRHELPWFNRAA